MNYFAIIYNSECKIQGPHLGWKDACISAYGCIANTMRIKYLGQSYDYATKSKHIATVLNDPDGWFVPMVVAKPLTMDPSQALGPDEIQAALSKLMESVHDSTTLEQVAATKDKAIEYLRHVPISLCELFNHACECRVKIIEFGAIYSNLPELKS